MNNFISVDPGVKACYWAHFGGLEPRLLLNGWGSDTHNAALLHIVELPQVYGAGARKGDQNDLVRLAFAAGRFTLDADVQLVWPREWKGTINPDVMVERIKSRLTPGELKYVQLPSAKSLHHNVWDSIGIGLYACGRLQPRKAWQK